MILIIDNYDSFVYNLARYVVELDHQCEVYRNDKISLLKIKELNPTHIIISPGPCTPNEAGVSLDIIKYLGATTPILGVCLGHQAIGQAFGGKVVRAQNPMHGKASWIKHNGTGLFHGLEQPLQTGRYHSLVVSSEQFPQELEITGYCEQGEIMALQHKHYPIFGVQFHPESVLTKQGHQLLKNFIK